jgi:hypothetical protein
MDIVLTVRVGDLERVFGITVVLAISIICPPFTRAALGADDGAIFATALSSTCPDAAIAGQFRAGRYLGSLTLLWG